MTPYPPHVTFDTPARRAFAESFADDLPLFYAGNILNDVETGWENVLQHCLTCALVADVLLEWVDDAALPREDMVRATFTHDAYKRLEVEAYATRDDDPSFFWHVDAVATDWMRAQGTPESVLQWFDAFGNNAAKRLHRNTEPLIGERILHLVDDSVHGEEFVGFDARLRALEENPRYRDQNEWSRRHFDGETLYGAKRTIHEESTKRFCMILGIDGLQPFITALVSRIKQRLRVL